MNLFNVSVLSSTRGSNLPGLCDGLKNTHVKIVDVITNKENAGIIEKAKSLSLPHFYFPKKEFEEKAHAHLTQNKIDLIVLMGFMKILSADFVSKWKNKIINVHPSLLPKHKGLMDLSVHQAVLDAKENETGCTVHWVTNKVDAGEIVLQKKCSVLQNDTAESLKLRVQQLEVFSLIEAVNTICVL